MNNKLDEHIQAVLMEYCDRAYYERLVKTSFTEEIIVHPEELGCPQSVLEECREYAVRGGRHAIKVCLAAIEKYPHIPSLKNFLTVAYQRNGKYDQITKVLQSYRELHPDYLFGKIAEAEFGTEDDLPTRFRRVFGSAIHVEEMKQKHEKIHISEVRAFMFLTITYFSEIKD